MLGLPGATRDIGVVGRGEFALSGPGRLEGTPEEGGTLRVVGPDTVTPTPTTTRYHWTIGEGAQAEVVETEAPELALTAAHVGRPVSVRVRYESVFRASWSSLTLTGETGGPTATEPVRSTTPLEVTAQAEVSGHTGTPRFGDRLRATGGSFAPAADTVTYRWHRDGDVVATGPEYVIGADDLDSTIALSMLGQRQHHPDTTSTPVEIGVVDRAEFVLSGPGRLDGTPREGSTLRVIAPDTIDPTPATATYHWTIGEGARTEVVETAVPTLALTAAHVGRPVSVRVRYESHTHASWTSPTLTGAPGGPTATGPVQAATPGPGPGVDPISGDRTPLAVVTPARIKGKARTGKRLRAVLPQLSGPAATYRYQWLRNGRPIKVGTHASYQLRRTDRGRRITVRVTASTPGLPEVVSVSPAKRVKR